MIFDRRMLQKTKKFSYTQNYPRMHTRKTNKPTNKTKLRMAPFNSHCYGKLLLQTWNYLTLCFYPFPFLTLSAFLHLPSSLPFLSFFFTLLLNLSIITWTMGLKKLRFDFYISYFLHRHVKAALCWIIRFLTQSVEWEKIKVRSYQHTT